MVNFQKLGFIGAGNMASAIISGLVKNGYPPKQIWVSNPSEAKLEALKELYGIQISIQNNTIVENSDCLVLAVKPQVLPGVLAEVAEAVQLYQPLVISIAAGVSLQTLKKSLGSDSVRLIRCMPNTPARIQMGMTGLFAGPDITEKDRLSVEQIFKAVGEILWVTEESQINQITAVAGSGPAYFFYFMEALEEAAEKMGFEKKEAKKLVLQTALGAALLAKEDPASVKTLREQVTSRGGTTEKAIQLLESSEWKTLLGQAVNAALLRAAELEKS